MDARGNITVGGSLAGNQILLNPDGNLFANGAKFQSPDIRARTSDFFANFPNSAAIPGVSIVIGATSLGQLGPNQLGVALPLLAGNGAPYILEFTTGTGQPYILATQVSAVPQVGPVIPISTLGAFPSRVAYTEEELNMMTPEERSAFEASRRQQSARVILQRENGESEEIGLPAEGETPQAKAPEDNSPAPTAQVILDGKPLAGKLDKEKGDSTQLLRLRPTKAVALRGETDWQSLMQGERLTAEVNIGSVPVARK